MNKLVLSLILLTLTPNIMAAKTVKTTKRWKLKRVRRALQNRPTEIFRPQRREETDTQRCLPQTREIINIFAKVATIGVTIATFILGLVI